MFGNFVEAELMDRGVKKGGDPEFVATGRKRSINLANVQGLEIVGDNVTCVISQYGGVDKFTFVKGTPESLFEDSIRQMIARRGAFENKLMEEAQAAAQTPVIVTP